MKRFFLAALFATAVTWLDMSCQTMHDFIRSTEVTWFYLYIGTPMILLMAAFNHTKEGFRSLIKPGSLVQYVTFLSLWALVYWQLHPELSSLDEYWRTSWQPPLTILYFAMLLVVMSVAAWRRRHPRASQALQRRTAPQVQPAMPRGGVLQPRPEPLRPAAYPLAGAQPAPASGQQLVRAFIDMTRAEMTRRSSQHRGPMRAFFFHERNQDGEFMISREEYGGEE